MWDVRACRSCLAVKGKLEKIGEAFKRQYTAITGLQISDDGYPTYFCMECRHHLKKSLAFRRKSRRAHFVLKEIMAVRKQISYSDIVTVNRKKTNLESSLNYWEPDNNGCYLIANLEAPEIPEDDDLPCLRYDLEPLELSYTKSYSTNLVDIEPDVIEPIEPPEPPVQPSEPTKDRDDNGFADEDIPSNDYLDTEADTNIDMNDIFKDLEEPTDNDIDDNDGIEELKPPESVVVKRKKEIKERDDLAKIPIAVKTLVEILDMYDLRVLSVEEQQEKFEMRKKETPFAYAQYKCAMCLTVCPGMNELQMHVKFHNRRKYKYDCTVCKNKLPTEEDLNAHTAIHHMYEYACRKCDGKFYSQMDAIRHCKSLHFYTVAASPERKQKRRKKVVLALRSFSIKPLSQEMMREVMTLGARAEGPEAEQPESPPAWRAKDWMKCDICGLWMSNRDDLEKHMTLKHRFMYTCKFCKEVFTTRHQAIEHGDTHDKNFECGECGKVFDTKSKFQVHYTKNHIKRKSVPCNLCGVTAKHDKLLYKHQLKQHGYISLNDKLTGDPRFKCRQCSVQFADKRGFEQHLLNMNHEGADSVQLACIPCKKIFEDAEQLETHLITCLYSRKYPRNCCYCPELLNNPQEYKSHYFNEHPTLPYRYVNRNCICDVCGKSVFRPQLEAHLKTHTAGGYTCRHCSFHVTSAARYLAHVINCHTPRPYMCTLCPQRFKRRHNLKRHVLKIHAPMKLYKCNFCGKEFSYFHNLKEHCASLHNLAIPCVKPKFPMNSRKKLYVYAHMSIEINEIERPIVEKADIELVDYLELKSKPVDYKNYFVFNPNVEENVYYKKMKQKQRRKKKVKQTEQSELEAAVAHIKNEAVINEGNVPSEVYEEMKMSEMEIDSEMYDAQLDIKTTESTKIHKIESVDSQLDIKKSTKIESVDSQLYIKTTQSTNIDKIESVDSQLDIKKSTNIDKIESLDSQLYIKTTESTNIDKLESVEVSDQYEADEMAFEDSALPLEVIESDGHQYVMIDGEMYRIACEDEL